MYPVGSVQGFAGSSAAEESAYNSGDPNLIPGSGRSAGEGIGYPFQYSWVSLVAQLVKNLPSLWETWVRSLIWEDPLETEMATHSSILTWRIPWTVYPWGRKESDTTEWLSLSVIKNPPVSAGDVSLIHGSGRSSGGGNGNPLQYSCLGNPMGRGAWQATYYPQRVRHNWQLSTGIGSICEIRPGSRNPMGHFSQFMMHCCFELASGLTLRYIPRCPSW